MTSYINQTMAREHVSELIAQAESARVRRELRTARREARRERRLARRAAKGPSNSSLYSPNRFGLAGVR